MPAWLIPAAAFLLLTLLERRRPLRARVEPVAPRLGRNLAMAALSAAALALVHRPVVPPLARLARERGLGLLRLRKLPRGLELVLGILLLDYTLWWWHRINHRVGLFWRFHAVHHMDRDLDASTALRFHFGEMTLSVGYRALQVLLLGPSAEALSAWQTLLGVSILFHHADVALPLGVERRLVWLVVTPRMHGIHHSIVPAEANANYSSLLSLWDDLHGTRRLGVPQAEITIGLPSHPEAEAVVLPRLLAAPFAAGPPEWRGPDGEAPSREGSSGDEDLAG